VRRWVLTAAVSLDDDRDDQAAENGVDDAAVPAEQRGATDDRRADGQQQRVAGAGV
jgi:hypothetical protein